jgi:hypothetical protein
MFCDQLFVFEFSFLPFSCFLFTSIYSIFHRVAPSSSVRDALSSLTLGKATTVAFSLRFSIETVGLHPDVPDAGVGIERQPHNMLP